MARRAQQAASCPWCEAPLDPRAAQCPGCRLPLTMAAVDLGVPDRATRPAGTSSTASVGSSTHYRIDPQRLPPARRAHRMRVTAGLLALTAAILLVAGITSWITVRDPDVQADVAAKLHLTQALLAAQGGDVHVDPLVAVLDGAEASDQPDHLSVRREGDAWFGAAQSTSGRCYVVASRTRGGAPRFVGTLDKGAPCTGDQVRATLGDRLRDAGG